MTPANATVDATAERNKTLARQMIQEIDSTPGLDVTDKWMTPDVQVRLNGGPPMDLAGYRGMMGAVGLAFSNMSHEVHHVLAERDKVAVAMTIHATHTGSI